MDNHLENDLWEFLLKAAVIENSLNELSAYPPAEESNKIQLPEHYDFTMRKFINHVRRKARVQSAFKKGQKIASIVLFLLGISFAFLLLNRDVRAACQDVIIRIYDTYIQYTYTVDTAPADTITLDHIPDGFQEVRQEIGGFDGFIEYQNAGHDRFILYYNTKKHVFLADTEHYVISPVTIQGRDGTYYGSTDPHFMNILLWDTQNAHWSLHSTLAKEEMIKIAENIK